MAWEPGDDDRSGVLSREDLEHAFEEWRPRLEGWLRKNAPRDVLDHESAADLAQSVFREALERIERGELRDEGKLALLRWFYRASEWKLRNRWRYWKTEKRGAAATLRVPDPLSDASCREELRTRIGSPSEAMMREEAEQRFEQALASLDERQRAVIALFYLQELRHAEIARQLGIEESHSRTILARGLARLSRVLCAE